MRPRRPSTEHQEAVSRRLAQLSAQLAAVRTAAPVEHDRSQPEPEWYAEHTHIPGPHVPAPRHPAHAGASALADADPDPGPDPAAAAVAVDEAPVVPVPGRHAARRAGRAVAALVPETLRGRVLLGPGQVSVVAVLVATALALTCWWLVRGEARQVEAPRVTPATAAPLAPTDVAAPTDAAGPTAAAVPGLPADPGAARPIGAAGTVTVDVAGRVRHPGIAVLGAGARVVDALTAAGGARAGVDLSGLNLARVLLDGEQILVGEPVPSGVAASAVPSPGAAPVTMVNLNTATETDLEALPEVGPVTAQAIIAWRTDHGGFSAVDELLEVDGIGDATLGQIAPYVTI